MDMSFRHKLDREILELADVKNQMDLKGIYRTFYLNTKKYTFSTLQKNSPKLTTYTVINQVSTYTNNSLQSIRPPEIKTAFRQQKQWEGCKIMETKNISPE